MITYIVKGVVKYCISGLSQQQENCLNKLLLEGDQRKNGTKVKGKTDSSSVGSRNKGMKVQGGFICFGRRPLPISLYPLTLTNTKINQGSRINELMGGAA